MAQSAGAIADPQRPNQENRGDWTADLGAQAVLRSTPGQKSQLPLEDEFRVITREAMSQGITHMVNAPMKRWVDSYRAYNNQHSSGSKYLSARYRGRSHLFRPKTRAAVRKTMTAAANALFATSDVVDIKPGNARDPGQVASAAINKELLNYRLDSGSEENSIPWFMVSMGACQTATITGLCVSKQYWERRDEPTGNMVLNPMTGMEEPEKVPLYSRPVIELYPPESVIRDPGAKWINQAMGMYLGLRNPISIGDLKQMIEESQSGQFPMRPDITEAEMRAAINDYDAAGVRRAREQGGDRMTDAAAQAVSDFDMVWLTELFVRWRGQEWCYWVLGTETMASQPRLLKVVYPWTKGKRRPVKIGIACIDAFKIDPMSPVESWQPLQAEINDVVNLRLDNLKQNMSPITKVVRGRGISTAALQNRSPDNILYVTEQTDIEFDRPASLPSEAYGEVDRLNSDFDDIAGLFSQGSVATNRQLNETVGGMQLLSASANAMGEFDLRVWVETWVEPVLRDMVALEQYYENDPTIMALCGEKAQLRQKFGIDVITDQLLEGAVTTKVSVGIGAADPMQRISKMGAVNQMLVQTFGDLYMQQANLPAMAQEAWGAAGFNDGAERFLRPEAAEDPRLMQAQQMIEEQKKALEDRSGDWENKERLAQIQAAATLLQSEQTAAQESKGREEEAGFEERGKREDHKRSMEMKGEDHKAEIQKKALDNTQKDIEQKRDIKAKGESEDKKAKSQMDLAQERVNQTVAKETGKAPPKPKSAEGETPKALKRKLTFVRDELGKISHAIEEMVE